MNGLDLLEYPAGLMERLEREAADERARNPRRVMTIFPSFEALLGIGAYQAALGFVADREAMHRFNRHLSDFVLCELFPEYLPHYEAFMRGEGEQLKERWTAEESKRCERAMICLLGIARAIHDDHAARGWHPCRISWTAVTGFVRTMMAQAPRPKTAPPQ